MVQPELLLVHFPKIEQHSLFGQGGKPGPQEALATAAVSNIMIATSGTGNDT
jgi:hypothetical protein